MLMLYRSKLLQDGLSSVEADQVLTGLRAKVMTDSNKHYERQDPQFKTDPNAFLVEIASKLPPGKALDLGMGEGRNAIFLAQLGWDVTAIDTAEAGIAKAKNAPRLSVSSSMPLSRMPTISISATIAGT